MGSADHLIAGAGLPFLGINRHRVHVDARRLPIPLRRPPWIRSRSGAPELAFPEFHAELERVRSLASLAVSFQLARSKGPARTRWSRQASAVVGRICALRAEPASIPPWTSAWSSSLIVRLARCGGHEGRSRRPGSMRASCLRSTLRRGSEQRTLADCKPGYAVLERMQVGDPVVLVRC